MNKEDIMRKIQKSGFQIESSMNEFEELKFYCNDGENRFFISIKIKGVV